jgi:hypothetical protein
MEEGRVNRIWSGGSRKSAALEGFEFIEGTWPVGTEEAR